MVQDFGIIIACCDRDYMFAKGCCASIRHFLGDVPICLLIDGEFSVQPLVDAYQVKVIKRSQVQHPLLRQKSFGLGYTKMVTFWESPWEYYLYLDSDTTVWGDVLKFADFENYDCIVDLPQQPASDEDITRFFFDINQIGQYFPDFRWWEHRHHYYCAGVFFGKRGIFPIEEYAHMLELVEQNPTLFFMGDQGFFNLMMCRAADEGRIRLGQAPIQLLVPNFDQQDLKKRFPITKQAIGQTEPLHQGEDVVIHWCGQSKPVSGATQVYTEPMTFHRRQCFSDLKQSGWLHPELLIKQEDLQYYFYSYKRKVQNKLRQLRHPKAVAHQTPL